MNLPEPVPPVLSTALAALEPEAREKATARLIDGQRTAEDLSHYFLLVGAPVSASTIRTYRRYMTMKAKVQDGAE